MVHRALQSLEIDVGDKAIIASAGPQEMNTVVQAEFVRNAMGSSGPNLRLQFVHSCIQNIFQSFPLRRPLEQAVKYRLPLAEKKTRLSVFQPRLISQKLGKDETAGARLILARPRRPEPQRRCRALCNDPICTKLFFIMLSCQVLPFLPTQRPP
jgi:hypothetical protein